MTNITNNLKSKNKKAFTMVEILMITIVIGIGLLSIIVAISKAKGFTNQTKQSVIATQLAQEGIEIVYQIRNTNLLKHSNYKNYCRLNENPQIDCNDLKNPNRITEKNYILSGQQLSGSSEILNISDGINSGDLTFGLCLTGGQRKSCPGSDNQTKYGKFFRTIEGKGLYIKDVDLTGGDKIVCKDGGGGGNSIILNNDYTCGDTESLHPMELHICSKVEYIGTKNGNVEICGVLTNFFD